jgi:hypothetical protein
MNRDYAEGLRHGHTDGKGGDNNLPARAAKRLIKLDQLLPGATNRHDEYTRGYKQGNEDEQRVRTAAASGSLSNLSIQEMSMSTSDVRSNVQNQVHGVIADSGSLAGQLQMLVALKKHLELLVTKLDVQAKFYASYVNNLGGDGLLKEMHRDVEGEMLQSTQNLRNVIAQIDGGDLPRVSAWIRKLEDLLN